MKDIYFKHYLSVLLAATLITPVVFLLPGCGGGSNGSGGIDIQGTLTSAGIQSLNIRVAGTPLGNVQVCALGGCDVTDPVDGSFGFRAGEGFQGGDVLFTFNGQGVSGSAVVPIKKSAKKVIVVFVHDEIDDDFLPESVEEIEEDGTGPAASSSNSSQSNKEVTSDDSGSDSSSSSEDNSSDNSSSDDKSSEQSSSDDSSSDNSSSDNSSSDNSSSDNSSSDNSSSDDSSSDDSSSDDSSSEGGGSSGGGQ
ncbi:MAG: hypothetical protein D6719_08640 [Candidatus Dadabacteria bacterium]|nr:MAG: hypothetical protein D6719_08640 [Candidatus Dadabacteria bacterium]